VRAPLNSDARPILDSLSTEFPPSSPICSSDVPEKYINQHIDNGCAQPLAASSSKRDQSIPECKRALNDKCTWRPKSASTALSQAGLPGNKTLAPIFASQKRKTRDADELFLSPEPSTLPLHLVSSPSAILSTASQPKRARTGMSGNIASVAPLADRMRPQTLDDFVGQESVVGKDSLLRGLLESGSACSFVLVRPP